MSAHSTFFPEENQSIDFPAQANDVIHLSKNYE